MDAAIEIADADGLGAVSMAAVATRLGYTPMSLYRYVSAKDDLMLLMQETATGLRRRRCAISLTEGAVGVRLPRDEGSFKSIEAPSVLGELSFFDCYPRSATLEAVTDVEVVRLDVAAFDRLLEHAPEIANLMLRDLARILALACGWPAR